MTTSRSSRSSTSCASSTPSTPCGCCPLTHPSANIFRASIIDVSTTTLTLAIIGEESKDDALERLLREFGILELVRTGMVALERGRATISDNADNKETDEFELGKNVL